MYLSLLSVVWCVAAAASLPAAQTSARPTVYNYVRDGSEDAQKAVRAAYGTKFKIIDFNVDRRYQRSKCTYQVKPQPQRTESGRRLTGDVRVMFIVTAEGRVLEPVVIGSTEERLNETVLGVIRKWRGTPARLNGSPVAVILHQDFSFR